VRMKEEYRIQTSRSVLTSTSPSAVPEVVVVQGVSVPGTAPARVHEWLLTTG